MPKVYLYFSPVGLERGSDPCCVNPILSSFLSLMDVQLFSNLGLDASIDLKVGLMNTYKDFMQNHYARVSEK
jgi:hypothetical protein